MEVLEVDRQFTTQDDTRVQVEVDIQEVGVPLMAHMVKEAGVVLSIMELTN